MFKSFVIAVLFFVTASTQAFDAAPRHNQGGTIGPNGVRQRVSVRIQKLKTDKDVVILQVDLGDHKYDSNKPALLTERPVITLTIGSLPAITGTANDKFQIIGEHLTGKLTNKGAGMQFTIKKATLTALLSDLSGKGEHADLTVTITDNHPPAASASAPRHAGVLYTNPFEVDVEENTKILTGKG